MMKMVNGEENQGELKVSIVADDVQKWLRLTRRWWSLFTLLSFQVS